METILIVDDKDSNRALVREILKLNDFSLLEARDSREALEVHRSHAGRIDLLITDLVMPDLNGIELARQIRPQRPEMKVLYMSGYMADAEVEMEVWDARADFLPKPFTPDALVEKVLDLLQPAADPEDGKG